MINANIKLIQFFCDNNLLRKYAVWIKLKSIHINSTYYNFTYSGIANKCNISRNTAKKYLEFFVNEGWAKSINGNITFIGQPKLKALYNVTLKHNDEIGGNTIQEIVNNLRFQLIKHKYNQYSFKKQVYSDLIDPKGKGALKRYKKAQKLINRGAISLNTLPGEKNENFKMSFKTIAKNINMSSATAFKLFRGKEKENKLTIIRQRAKSSGDAYKINIPFLKSNQFIYNGFIYNALCNKYVFN